MTDQKIQQSQGTRPGLFYGYIVVAAAFCLMVTNWGSYFVFGVFFNPVSSDFGWPRALTSGAFSLATILHGLMGIVMGFLTDRLGPRLVMTISCFLLGMGYLLMSQVSSIWQLYLFYGVIVGTGMGGAWVPLLSTVARWFAKRRGMMTGIVLTGTGIGTLVLSPAASWLISVYNWRVSYLILGSLVLVVGILAAQFLKRDPARMGQVPYGEKEVREPGIEVYASGYSLGEAVRTRQFWVFLAMELFFGLFVFSVMVHIVPHAIDLGISSTSAAAILAASGALNISGRVILGGTGDRIGNKQVFLICFSLMTVAFFWLVPAKELWMLYLFAIAFGFAQGGMGAVESPMVASLFGLRSHGLIFGVCCFVFTIGAATGPIMTGYIFDVNGSYQTAFLVYGALSVASLISAILLTPIRVERSRI